MKNRNGGKVRYAEIIKMTSSHIIMLLTVTILKKIIFLPLLGYL